jgi:ribbon-helix-helix CopG family protein
MTFSIHLDESLAERLNRTAKESGSRMAGPATAAGMAS